MSFSVIIPSRTIDNLRPCVSCIRAAHEKARIIVVDDFDEVNRSEPQALADCTWVKGVRPFVFSRNINIGIAAAGDDDVVLSNDDACLRTPYGFSYLASIAKEHPEYGIISAAMTGAVGNEEQIARPGSLLRETTHHTLVFVCVYIRRAVLNEIEDDNDRIRRSYGKREWLDERYVNYGFDDDDFCEQVRNACGPHRLNGPFKLGIFDGCVVEHGVLPSTYRGAASASVTNLRPNRERFIEKWGFAPGQGPSMQKPATTPEAPKW